MPDRRWKGSCSRCPSRIVKTGDCAGRFRLSRRSLPRSELRQCFERSRWPWGYGPPTARLSSFERIAAARIKNKNFERADRRISFGSVEIEFDRARVLEIGRLLFDGLTPLLV